METLTMQKHPDLEGFCSLYYLMIEADGVVTEKEVALGKLMCEYEKFDEVEFKMLMNKYKTMSKEQNYKNCVSALLKCSRDSQIRCMAWMSKIANTNGFMSPEEWKLLFNLYKKELKLNQQDIIVLQRQLPKF